MMTLDDFTKYYSTISNADLLDILANRGEYQPLAIEAAKIEFSRRQLSNAEIEQANEVLAGKQKQKEKQKEKIKLIEERVKTTGHTFWDTLNPIQSGTASTEKTIRFIVIVFSGLLAIQLIKDFRMHLIYAKGFSHTPFLTSLYFLPFIILFLSLITFWKRKKIGWKLLAIFLTYSAIQALGMLIYSFTQATFDEFLNLFPESDPGTHIVQSLFFGGVLFVICKKNIRTIFSINKQSVFSTIGVTGFFTLACLLVLLFL